MKASSLAFRAIAFRCEKFVTFQSLIIIMVKSLPSCSTTVALVNLRERSHISLWHMMSNAACRYRRIRETLEGVLRNFCSSFCIILVRKIFHCVLLKFRTNWKKTCHWQMQRPVTCQIPVRWDRRGGPYRYKYILVNRFYGATRAVHRGHNGIYSYVDVTNCYCCSTDRSRFFMRCN